MTLVISAGRNVTGNRGRHYSKVQGLTHPTRSPTTLPLQIKQKGPPSLWGETTAETGDDLQQQAGSVPLALAGTEPALCLVVLSVSMNFQEPTSKVTSGVSHARVKELSQSTAPTPVLLVEFCSRGFLIETSLAIYNMLHSG